MTESFTPKSEFLRVLTERGYIHQMTDAEGLDAYLAKEKDSATAYIGFDCTAKSLHVGSLIQIMLLHWFEQCGHRPIVLMGGGTTKVGDPSGKDESRKLLTEHDIQDNMNGIKQVFSRFVTFEEQGGPARMVNNADWLDALNYITFLRDFGRHFSVNRMLSMDSVKLRLEREQHLSFLEFNYMILQAYDFVELSRRNGCRLQMGGSDQWGNIVNGTDLSHALQSEAGGGKPKPDTQLFGLTTPLLTTSTGAKMGKTAQGAVWLSADMLPVYDYWQFWRNTADADVERFLKLFTTLEMAEIKRLSTLQGAEINEAKKVLATEATALCHGRDAANAAAQTAQTTFEQGGLGQDLPVYEVPASALAQGIPAFKLFAEAFGTSGGEARRLISGGGARIQDIVVSGESALCSITPSAELRVTPETISIPQGGEAIKLSSGKKRHALLKIV